MSILILSDGWTAEDVRFSRPFCGADGHILRGLLAQAGIGRTEVEYDVVFPMHLTRHEEVLTKGRTLASDVLPTLTEGQYLRKTHEQYVLDLHRRIAAIRPNVVIALGPIALWAVSSHTGIKKWRGSPLLSPTGQKVMATWHPSSIMRQWELRSIVLMDLRKALSESEYPELRRPSRIIHLNPTLSDMELFYGRYIIPAPVLSVDIETKAGSITEIGFATSKSRALVVPFWHRARGNYWSTLEAELLAWAWVRRVLAEKPVIGQNFQYDFQYLWKLMGIPIPHYIGDTMLLHHSLQPEMQKSLGFLGSIYTSEPAWKFMRTDHAEMKRNDE
jgi:uracil-DNA glycosylase